MVKEQLVDNQTISYERQHQHQDALMYRSNDGQSIMASPSQYNHRLQLVFFCHLFGNYRHSRNVASVVSFVAIVLLGGACWWKFSQSFCGLMCSMEWNFGRLPLTSYLPHSQWIPICSKLVRWWCSLWKVLVWYYYYIMMWRDLRVRMCVYVCVCVYLIWENHYKSNDLAPGLPLIYWPHQTRLWTNEKHRPYEFGSRSTIKTDDPELYN